ncbi:translocation/assembly module TamB domain-containing protein [Mitsuokella sp. oral taxon 131]|uniref:translocation/assembly module TamB domain-containing protein n=1 Tax=Mitsuokella sp. oral taxon 131 TaxID=1321780 RepID=UPI0003AE7AA2|nr:translocation/assembly module TamB domain-containing protein [Mitsuokella sp. oral taxon 131]ERL25162.1 hypothetical protein HMPREF1985_00220 [Mitsuokella sp. oral taxon 131 str. W9106]
MKRKAIGIFILVSVVLAVFGGWAYIRTASFMEHAGEVAGETMSSALGVMTQVGAVEVDGFRGLMIHDITIYDKQAKPIVHADSARVSFRLLSSLTSLSVPADAVKDITLTGAAVTLEKREDGSWNVSDLASDKGETMPFHGRVHLEDAHVAVRVGDKEIVLHDVTGSADCADYPVLRAEATATCEGASISASGTYRKERQIVNLAVSDADLSPFLPLLPDGILPDGVTVEAGHVGAAHLAGQYYGSVLSYTGDATFDGGRAEVLGTAVENIAGSVFFTDAEARVNARAEAAGQKADVRGKVRMGAGAPDLDLTVTSDSFAPAAIRTELPYAGTVAFTATVAGKATDPTVNAKAQADAGTLMGIPFSAASANVRYRNGHVYVQDLHAQTFGGEIAGEAEFAASDFAYSAHLKAKNIDLVALHSVVPQTMDLTGRVTFDIGASGIWMDDAARNVYGSVELQNGGYKALPIERADASIDLSGDALHVDYASFRLPNGTSLGIEGTVDLGKHVDLAFYGGHADLSLVQMIIPQADVTGLGDFAGTVRGAVGDPKVELKFTAMHGTLFKQPFDNVRLKAAGSLSELMIEDFSLVQNGKQRWYVEGSVGLAGEQRVNLRVDTVGVRAEDLAALVAPDEPITGNVDNTIRITGTLDDPQAIGYIHFYRGSYKGVLLSGMDGDYTLESGRVHLKDFHIFSPWVDVDVNGIVDRTGALDVAAQVHEFDMKRIASKFPYPVSGKGKFDGHIGGTVSDPTFDGHLTAPSILLNGQELTDMAGDLSYYEGVLRLDHFGFAQGEGKCHVSASIDTESRVMDGMVSVRDVDLSALGAVLNQRNDLVTGRISGEAVLGGTYDSPAFTANAFVAKGLVAGYDMHDISIQAHMEDGTLYVDSLKGMQGENGMLSVTGSAGVGDGMDGRLQGNLEAESLALGLFAKMGGIATPVAGTADISATFDGTIGNPSANIRLFVCDGGFAGGQFDRLEGTLALKNGLIHVDTLRVQKAIGGKPYEASAEGIVPLRALTAGDAEELADYEQIKLKLSLDKADLSLLPVVSDSVEWAMGATNGDVEITGTAAHPFFNGHIIVPAGAMKFRAIATPVTDMVMRLDFHDNVMTVREFSGKMGNGSYAGSGKVVLEGRKAAHYEGSLTASGLDVKSSFFHGPVDAEIKVSETEVFGRKMPLLSGNLNLHDCLISVPTIPDRDRDLPLLALDFDVQAGDRVHAYSPHLYDMYLKGQVHFGGTTQHPKTQGTIAARRGGTITYLQNVFSVREGTAYFNQFDTFLPSISFFADTRLSRMRVFLALQGRLDAMEFKLSSSPEMSQEEILKVLTFRNAGSNGELKFDAEDVLLAGLQMSVLGEVEDAVRKFLWLDRFTVAGGNGSLFSQTDTESNRDRDVYHIEMGKYITDKVMVRYSQGISGTSTSRIGLQYDLDDRYGISLDKEGGEYIISGEARIRF